MESLVFFEDELVRNFYPITLTRPGFDLRLGPLSLLGWAKAKLNPGSVGAFVRRYLQASVASRHLDLAVNNQGEVESDEAVLLMNSLRNPMTSEKSILQDGYWYLLSNSKRLLAARLRRDDLTRIMIRGRPSISKIKGLDYLNRVEEKSTSALLSYPWHILEFNPLANSTRIGKRRSPPGPLIRAYEIIGQEKKVWSYGRVEIEPHVILDTRKGPISFQDNVIVEAFSRIEGPCSIGNGSKVRSGSSIRNTTIGDYCVIGGEVEGSVIHDFSNKAHDGYLGDSIVGSWINIGAMTTNSNLKNTYGQIKMKIGPVLMNTGRQKFGSIIGDYTKTSIGSLLASAKIGVSSHVYGRTFGDVPSFTIYGKSFGKRSVELDVDSAIQTQARMMQRRGIYPTETELDLLRQVFVITKSERLNAKVRSGKFRF